MNVDTGSFRALQDRADTLDALAAEVSRLAGLGTVLSDAAAEMFCWRQLVELGRRLERGEAPGPRHARARTGRHRHLRVVDGGRQ